ncbi:MAG: replication initiator, partial [Streptosporangiaceae bacterium]
MTATSSSSVTGNTCSAVYKRDARQLVRAGLTGGKGIPETVASHPCVFATFTAPS